MRTAAICTITALTVALAFYLTATLVVQEPSYTLQDIYLGTVWTFILALIISAPIIIPKLKKRGTGS